MGRYRTSDEVKIEILAVLPGRLGELYYELRNNVTALHLNWQNYRVLYGVSPERIGLLNWAASLFFRLLDDILRHDVLMHIARLADPPRSMGRENASLERLVNELSASADVNFVQTLRTKVQEFQTHCLPIKQLRNRILAHGDLATALQYHPDPLPGISRAFIEDTLKKIRDIINDIEKKYFESTMFFEDVISQNDANSLIYVIESAKEHEVCRKNKYR